MTESNEIANESVKEVATITTKTGKTMFSVNCESGERYTTFDKGVFDMIPEMGLYKLYFKRNGNFKNFAGAEFIKRATTILTSSEVHQKTGPETLKEKVLEEVKYFLIMQGCIKAVVPTMIDELEKAFKSKGVEESEIKYLVKDCIINAPSMVNTLFMTLTDRRRI